MTTSTGDQDLVDILTTDHHEVLDLIGQIPGADPGQRRDMADTVIAELMRHSVAEEMYVYPAMKDHLPEGESRVQHDVEEHQQLVEIMKELEDVDSADPRFLQTLGRLETVLRDHVSDEENDQFPLLRTHLTREQLVEIGSKVETAKKAAPTRPQGRPRSGTARVTPRFCRARPGRPELSRVRGRRRLGEHGLGAVRTWPSESR